MNINLGDIIYVYIPDNINMKKCEYSVDEVIINSHGVFLKDKLHDTICMADNIDSCHADKLGRLYFSSESLREEYIKGIK